MPPGGRLAGFRRGDPPFFQRRGPHGGAPVMPARRAAGPREPARGPGSSRRADGARAPVARSVAARPARARERCDQARRRRLVQAPRHGPTLPRAHGPSQPAASARPPPLLVAPSSSRLVVSAAGSVPATSSRSRTSAPGRIACRLPAGRAARARVAHEDGHGGAVVRRGVHVLALRADRQRDRAQEAGAVGAVAAEPILADAGGRAGELGEAPVALSRAEAATAPA
jgi:hypothetical protein